MTRTRLRLAGIVVAAVVVYTALLAASAAGSPHSSLGILIMLGVSICAVIVVTRGRPLLMIAAAVCIIVYTAGTTVAAHAVWGREEDPFGPHCDGIEWRNLILDQRCDGPPDEGLPECFEAIADAPTWEELKGELLAYRDLGDVESVQTFASGGIDRGVIDRGTGRDVLRIVELLHRRDRRLAVVDVWRTDTGALAAGVWVQCD